MASRGRRRLRACVPPRTAVYVASDEFDLTFYEPLREYVDFYSARDFQVLYRDALEPRVPRRAYTGEAAAQRAKWVHDFYAHNPLVHRTSPLPAVGNLSAYEPVLMNNNFLFLAEQELHGQATRTMCTESRRCEAFQLSLFKNETTGNYIDDPNCKWILISTKHQNKILN